MHISYSIYGQAVEMFYKVKKEQPGFHLTEVAIFAVFYCAVKYANDSRRLEDFIMEEGSGSVTRVSKLGNFYPLWRISRSSLVASQIPQYCYQLGLSKKHLGNLIYIAENLPEDSYALNSCKLPTITAAVFYLYNLRAGLGFNPLAVSKIQRVTPNRIVACVKKLTEDETIVNLVAAKTEILETLV